MILLVSSYGCHSINSKAISPNADTIFYRINGAINNMESLIWKQGLQFLREKKRKLKQTKCYIIIDETYDSYTGKLIKKEKKYPEKLTVNEKQILRYIHKYKPEKGDTGSFKYLVFAIVYGNKRRVLRVKAIKRNEKYKNFTIKTLIQLKKEVDYECAIFDRGFYDGLFIDGLQKNNIPFIVRARLSKTMQKLFGFFVDWKCYDNYEIGEHKIKTCLILGADYTQGKRTKWGFITNLKFSNWYDVRKIYKKRWNIENIFKATDGIQLRAQTNNPTTRLFCVCLSFLLYNAWQSKHKRKQITLANFVMALFELVFNFLLRIKEKPIEFYRDKLRINIPLWDRIISSI